MVRDRGAQAGTAFPNAVAFALAILGIAASPVISAAQLRVGAAYGVAQARGALHEGYEADWVRYVYVVSNTMRFQYGFRLDETQTSADHPEPVGTRRTRDLDLSLLARAAGKSGRTQVHWGLRLGANRGGVSGGAVIGTDVGIQVEARFVAVEMGVDYAVRFRGGSGSSRIRRGTVIAATFGVSIPIDMPSASEPGSRDTHRTRRPS